MVRARAFPPRLSKGGSSSMPGPLTDVWMATGNVAGTPLAFSVAGTKVSNHTVPHRAAHGPYILHPFDDSWRIIPEGKSWAVVTRMAKARALLSPESSIEPRHVQRRTAAYATYGTSFIAFHYSLSAGPDHRRRRAEKPFLVCQDHQRLARMASAVFFMSVGDEIACDRYEEYTPIVS
jgi:hypothetical protein